MSVTMDYTDQILKKIKSLPPMPLVVQKLLKVMENENSSAEDISLVLNSDQAMTSKVLKLVNSSFYGLSGEVTTVPRAIVILGVAAMRNLALGLGVARVLAKAGTGELQDKFWDHSITVAAACEVLAKHTKTVVPEEAFVAGLLHDIGHLVLLMAVPDEFLQVMELGPDNIVENERKIIGMAHTKAGQKLLKQWKLPTSLSGAVRFHHTPKVITGNDDPLTTLVALGDLMASIHGNIYERSLSESDFRKLVKVTGLNPEDVGEILDKMDNRITETKLFLKLATDAETGTASRTPQDTKTIVMICTDPLRSEWTRQVLGHFGHTILAMKEFFTRANEKDAADLIILDPDSISGEQLAKILPILKIHQEHLVIFGHEKNSQIEKLLGATVRNIPVAFSREDLETA